jgi:S-adenosylmethionine synthetase
MMFGYACKDTDNYMPLPLELSHLISERTGRHPPRRKGNDLPQTRFQITGYH